MKEETPSPAGTTCHGIGARRLDYSVKLSRSRARITTAAVMSVVFWRKIVRGLKEGLTEDERYAVADHTVTQLKERGDPWRLNEEAPAAKPPST